MNKKGIVITIIATLVVIVLFSSVIVSKNSKKDVNIKKTNEKEADMINRIVPAPGDNRYNLHCERITIFVDDKEVVELRDKEKEKLIDIIADDGFLEEYNVDEKIDDTYNITVDFNNGITILYMRKDDNYVYYDKGLKDNFRYELKDEVHDEIMNLIEKNQ